MLNSENSKFSVPAQDFSPTSSGTKKVILVHATGESEERSGQEVIISNGRYLQEPSLDTNGFVLCKNESKVKDFSNESEIVNTYYAEMVELLKKVTNANEVLIFNHTFRSGNELEVIEKKRKNVTILPPAKIVHNDYTDWSGPQEVKIRFPKQAENLLKNKFAIVHTWQPIKPITSDPLALVDAKTVQKEDLIVKTKDFGSRINQTYHMKFNSNHKWYYYPKMQPEEVLLFKGYDSEIDGKTRFTPHTSFVDSDYQDSATPRQSIELRAFVFF